MVTVDALRQVPLFGKLSDEQLQWLVAQGQEIWLQPGEYHRKEGDPADHVFVMLEGEVRVTEQVGNQELVLATYGPKTLFGELPILMGTPYYWATGRAVKLCHILELGKEAFWQMLREIPAVATAILQIMAERVQELQSMSQQREKLIELGTVAAGLAQELDYPAAAVHRDAQHLDEIFEALSSSLRLEEQSATDKQALRSGVGLLDEIEQSAAHISELVNSIKEYSYMDQAPLQEVDVHEGIESTLTVLRYKLREGVVVTREYDQSLPRISAYGSELNQVWTKLIDNAIDALEENSEFKIGVGVPAYGSGSSESGDLTQNSKLSSVGEACAKHVAERSATQPPPTIWIRTRRENSFVLVEIADNGTGIPPEIQPQIFEPFLTVEGVGQGTRLGLVASYHTIVGKHQGDIRVFSQPGDTRFQVRLPINQR